MTEVPEKPYGDWMQTFTGQAFYPADPMLMLAMERISEVDIAHALSMLCRYGGHVNRFYSVAEHSLYVSYSCDPGDELAGLLHDATEAYMQDLVRPVKNMLPAYRDMEDVLMAAIAKRFHLPGVVDQMVSGSLIWSRWTMPESVKSADNRILLNERDQLLGRTPQPWHPSIEALEPLDLGGNRLGFSPPQAKALWLQRFAELTRDAPWRG